MKGARGLYDQMVIETLGKYRSELQGSTTPPQQRECLSSHRTSEKGASLKCITRE